MDKLIERISTLEERLRTLKAQQTRSAARARTILGRRERKDDTRRKILAGAWVLTQVERGELSRESLQRSLDRFLTRPDERALFDLPPTACGAVETEGPPAEAATRVPTVQGCARSDNEPSIPTVARGQPASPR